MMVWDGLRPDSVTAQNTPTLFKLAQRGVTFSRHHPVYPSSTEVNGAALATGVYPARDGIMGNREYRPAINAVKPVAMEELETVRKGEGEGSYIAVATVAEILQQNGNRTAVAGSKGVALLADRSAEPKSDAARASADVFAGEATSAATLDAVVKAQGAFPAKIEFPNTRQDTWTTDALTKVLWKQDVPKFSVLWMSDADYSQHDTAPGSPTALAALKSCDDRLASVLATLDARGVRDTTSVFVVSDHGFSTIDRNVDIYAALQGSGFTANKEFTAPPRQGEVMVVGLGGSALFYVGGHDAAVTRRLVEFLQSTDFAGVIFTRDGVAGSFTLHQAAIDTPGAPDVAMSFRWGTGANAFGINGTIMAEGKRKAGQGSHASLSRFDMHNTLIVAGPEFKPGFVDELPSGNTDLAPTILQLLGVPSPHRMDGRVLSEALIGGEAKTLPVKSGQIESSSEAGGQKRRQYLKWSQVGQTVYLDEGNAETLK
jgi:arylsulfatase A-like enzyme